MNEIVLPESLTTSFNSTELDTLVKSGDYWPRVQVGGSNSNLVKEGKLPMGHFGLIWTNDNFKDLGTEFDFLSISFRSKALRIPGGDQNPISYYDLKSDDFQKCVKDSEVQDSGCMYGVEFFLWIPDVESFATYFFNNPTLRRVAPELMELMRRGKGGDGKSLFAPTPASTKINYIKGKKFSWHGALIAACSTPLPEPEEGFQEKVIAQVTKFRNPPKNEVTEAPASDRVR